QRRVLAVLRCGKNRARERRPHRRAIAGKDFRALAGCTPSRLAPVVAYDGNDVDEGAAADRIVHKVRPGAEPEIDRRGPQFGHQRVGGSERAPGGAAGKTRRAPVTPALPPGSPPPPRPPQPGAPLPPPS